jgi:GTP-binding protein
MLDDELEAGLAKELPEGIPSIFISSLAYKGITSLKDVLWKELNKQSSQDLENMVYRPADIKSTNEDEGFDYNFDDELEENNLNYNDSDWEIDEYDARY